MESDLFKTNMNLIRGDYYYSLDNTDHSFALLSQLSIIPLIWAKFRVVRMHWRHQPSPRAEHSVTEQRSLSMALAPIPEQ